MATKLERGSFISGGKERPTRNTDGKCLRLFDQGWRLNNGVIINCGEEGG